MPSHPRSNTFPSQASEGIRWVRPSGAGRRLLWSAIGANLVAAAMYAVGLVTSAYWLLPTVVGLALVIAIGVARAESGVFARPIVAFETRAPWLALSFDDGPHPVETPAILELLAQGNHKATFFVTGLRAQKYPDLIRKIADRGHTIANHSLRHAPWTPVLPAMTLARELAEANRYIEGQTGDQPRWFRAPVGLISPPVALAAQVAGMDLVHWTASARDGTARAPANACLARLLPHVHPGAILVLHDGVVGADGSVARQILPGLLAEMDRRGVRSVGLDGLLAHERGT